ncbi:hypothetical protein KSP40_PGU001769 [Platanthera guangdongensis]|uniref:Uncharacterized protein n=1 Tax=Platanthera guangdongensis TaxID=2320717 RepID=A0ABR2MU08_9ASPA
MAPRVVIIWGRFRPGVELSFRPEAREVMQEDVEKRPRLGCCGIGAVGPVGLGCADGPPWPAVQPGSGLGPL